MTERGDLRETYAAALQHDLIDLDGAEQLIGVVRRPLPWLRAQVDENRAALGPPADLLDDVKGRAAALEDDGLADAAAHNQAMVETNYRERYLTHLNQSPEAQNAITDIESMLLEGEDVVLVCYENTTEKRCHRTILQAVIEVRLAAD